MTISSTPPSETADGKTVFVVYLSARLISVAGAAATTVIVPVLVYASTGSAVLTGLTSGIGGASYFAFGIPFGHFVDRWPRGPVLVLCTLLRGLALGGMAASALLGGFTLPVLLTVLAVTNVLFVATDAAHAGALRALVGADSLQRANASVAGSSAIVEIAAPLAAGVVLHATSATHVFFVEAVALLFSAILLRAICRRLDAADVVSRSKPTWSAALSGFVFIWRSLPVRRITTAAFFFALTEGLVLGQLVVLFTSRYGEEESTALVAQAYTAIAIGSAVGSWLLTRIPFARRPLLVTSASFLCAAIALAGMLLAQSPTVTLAVVGLWAVPFIVVFVGSAALRQSVAADNIQGRVAVAGRLLTLGAGIPLGNALGGLISEVTSVDTTYLAAALLSLCVSAAFGLSSARNSLVRSVGTD
ncbi:MFS family permease [Rathayibacter agropyri]